jgi:hypothetical protein
MRANPEYKSVSQRERLIKVRNGTVTSEHLIETADDGKLTEYKQTCGMEVLCLFQV